MKKMLSLALCAALLAPASAAMALQDGLCRDVYVNDEYAGTITFYFDKDAGHDCAYESEWRNHLGNISLQCDVLEKKAKRSLSCLDNSYEDFVTTVRNNTYCDGFDQFGIPRYVEYLHAGEGYGLLGVIKFEGVSLPASFETT
jgi:hypothetical protein